MRARVYQCDRPGCTTRPFFWPEEDKPGKARQAAILAGWEIEDGGDVCGPCRFAPARAMPDAPAAVPAVEVVTAGSATLPLSAKAGAK